MAAGLIAALTDIGPSRSLLEPRRINPAPVGINQKVLNSLTVVNNKLDLFVILLREKALVSVIYVAMVRV